MPTFAKAATQLMTATTLDSRTEVAIGLSTYNGERFLRRQIESIRLQSHSDWVLLVRDDGSKDSTRALLEEYRRQDPRVLILDDSAGNVGPIESFSRLIQHAKHAGFRRLMLCDQDDEWESDKISISLQRLGDEEAHHPGLPILIHSDLTLVDAKGELLHPSFCGYSGLDPLVSSTSRLLLQNTVTGCTMLMNRELLSLIRPLPKEALMHDGWIALVASLFGRVEFIWNPTVRYRQHGANVVGAKRNSKIPYLRFLREYDFTREFFSQRRRSFIEIKRLQAQALISEYGGQASAEALSPARAFVRIAQLSWLQRRWVMLSERVLYQRFRTNIALFLLL